MTINQRIKFLVETYGKGNVSAFARSIDVSPTVIASYMPGGRESKPSYDVLEKILEAYPKLRLEWLMKGSGPTYEEPQTGGFSNVQTAKAHNIQGSHISTGGDQSQRIAELEREVEKWRSKYIELLEKQVGG
jgi:transcriptional regulator with XRE-family HTH domain